jgi:hypothetical protein
MMMICRGCLTISDRNRDDGSARGALPCLGPTRSNWYLLSGQLQRAWMYCPTHKARERPSYESEAI